MSSANSENFYSVCGTCSKTFENRVNKWGGDRKIISGSIKQKDYMPVGTAKHHRCIAWSLTLCMADLLLELRVNVLFGRSLSRLTLKSTGISLFIGTLYSYNK